MSLDWYIEEIFKGLPLWIAILIMIFIGILFIIWILLPLWVIFIQWNRGKIKEEMQNVINYLENIYEKRQQNISGPKD